MHLRVVQRRRHAIRRNEMFLRYEKTGAGAGFPLDRLLELLRGAIELRCDRRLRGRFRRDPTRSDQLVAELDGAPPNGDSGNEKENRRSDKHCAIVIRLKPVDDLRHTQEKRTTDCTDCTDEQTQARRSGGMHSSDCCGRNTRFHSNRAFLKLIKSARSKPMMFWYPIICATCVSLNNATTFGSTITALSIIRFGTRLPINSPQYRTGNELCTETRCPRRFSSTIMARSQSFSSNPGFRSLSTSIAAPFISRLNSS